MPFTIIAAHRGDAPGQDFFPWKGKIAPLKWRLKRAPESNSMSFLFLMENRRKSSNRG